MDPTVGQIVLYRSRAAVDMPAIITSILPDRDGQPTDRVHLHPFAPPGASPDILSYEWGTAQADGDEPRPMTWRALDGER